MTEQERLVLQKLMEQPEGVTYLDFVGTGIDEQALADIIQRLKFGIYESPLDGNLKEDA